MTRLIIENGPKRLSTNCASSPSTVAAYRAALLSASLIRPSTAPDLPGGLADVALGREVQLEQAGGDGGRDGVYDSGGVEDYGEGAAGKDEEGGRW